MNKGIKSAMIGLAMMGAAKSNAQDLASAEITSKKAEITNTLEKNDNNEKTLKLEIKKPPHATENNNINPAVAQEQLTKLQKFMKTQPKENQQELEVFYKLTKTFYELVKTYHTLIKKDKKEEASLIFKQIDEVVVSAMVDISRNHDEGTIVDVIATHVANITGDIELQNNEGKLGEAKRKTAEAKRKTAEAKRKTAEINKRLEESEKEKGEAKRKTAEAKRKTAEINKRLEESEKALEQSEKEKKRGTDFNIWAQNIQDKKGSPEERKKEAQRLYDIANPHGRLKDGGADQRLFDTYTKKLGITFD